MKERKNIFQTRSFRNGSYSAGIIAIVIAIVVVINMIIGQFPTDLLNIDLSENNLYEISDVSVEMLEDLDKDITFTVLAELDSVDSRIETFVKKYAGLSDRIEVEWIDTVQHPSALQTYDSDGNEIVVACEETGKSMHISFYDIITYDYSSYYTTGNVSESEFDAEGQLTSAVNYVASEESATIYRTSGHGESTFSTKATDLFTKNNIETTEINLSMKPEIPDDCDLLFLYAPTSDLTDDEKSIITDYLNNGGKVYVILGETQKDMPNLDAILEAYHLKQADGYIADAQRFYQGNYYAIFPILSLAGAGFSSGVENEMVLLYNSLGLEEVETSDDGVTMTPFLKTSSAGYAITEESETQGEYILGAVSTKSVEGADEEDTATTEEARLTVLGSASMIDSQIVDSFSNLDNMTVFMNSVTANFDEIENIAIEAKSLAIEYNTPLHAGAISMVLIIGIPLVIVIFGFIVWIRRRKA